jgi:hypothetical protein
MKDSLLILVAVIGLFIGCRNNSGRGGERDIVKNLFDTVAAKPVSLDAINQRSFQLGKEDRFFMAIDSQQIIAALNPYTEDSQRIYMIHPLSRKKYDSLTISAYWKPVWTQSPRLYNADEIEILKNNQGRLKIGLPEREDYYANREYVVSDLKQPANKITNKATGNLFVTDNLENVFFNNTGFTFINDSAVNIYELPNYRVIIKNKEQITYSVVDSARHINFIIGKNFQYDDSLSGAVQLFPEYNRLFFSGYPGPKGEQTILISYHIISGDKKKYIFPVTITKWWFAKDCIFFSYYIPGVMNDNRYSYISY